MQQQSSELERRVAFLEGELEKQTAFNKQIMKQMRKIEYALLQQKKHNQQQQQVQQVAQQQPLSQPQQNSSGSGQQKTTAVAQSISINNTQNNTIISAGAPGSHGQLLNEQGLNPHAQVHGGNPQQQLQMAQQTFQHRPSTSGGAIGGGLSGGLSGHGSFNATNMPNAVLNLSSSHKANTSNTSGATINTQSNHTNGPNNPSQQHQSHLNQHSQYPQQQQQQFYQAAGGNNNAGGGVSSMQQQPHSYPPQHPNNNGSGQQAFTNQSQPLSQQTNFYQNTRHQRGSGNGGGSSGTQASQAEGRQRLIRSGRDGHRHQRVNSDGAHMMSSVFQSYSGRMRIPSVTGINHKRGKSGQNEGLFKTTLEEIEDGVGVNSTYADMLNDQAENGEADQTAFIDQEQNYVGTQADHTANLSMDSTESLQHQQPHHHQLDGDNNTNGDFIDASANLQTNSMMQMQQEITNPNSSFQNMFNNVNHQQPHQTKDSTDPFTSSMDNIKGQAGIAKMNTFDAERHSKNAMLQTGQTMDSRHSMAMAASQQPRVNSSAGIRNPMGANASGLGGAVNQTFDQRDANRQRQRSQLQRNNTLQKFEQNKQSSSKQQLVGPNEFIGQRRKWVVNNQSANNKQASARNGGSQGPAQPSNSTGASAANNNAGLPPSMHSAEYLNKMKNDKLLSAQMMAQGHSSSTNRLGKRPQQLLQQNKNQQQSTNKHSLLNQSLECAQDPENIINNSNINGEDTNASMLQQTSSHQVLPQSRLNLTRSSMNQNQQQMNTTNPSFEQLQQLKQNNKRQVAHNNLQSMRHGTHLQFKAVCSLKSHMDVVRCLQFMPDSTTLVSASEDCTLKVWNLSQLAESQSQAQQVSDLEPYVTLRGHTGPILSIGTQQNGRSSADSSSNTNNQQSGLDSMLFSGGLNGAIHLWRVPNIHQAEAYGPVMNNQHQIATWEQAHENQPIWSLKLNSSGNLLSVGSDASVALWQAPTTNVLQTKAQGALNDPTEFLCGRFRKMGNLGHFLTPTSATWLPNNDKFAVSYRENLVSVFDVQSGNEIADFNFASSDDLLGGRQTRQEHFVFSQINAIEVCPEHNMIVAATEDSKLRFFDLNSSQLINSVIGHADSVSSLCSLSIQGQPNLIVSGGHDGALRVWDIRTFQLLHDMAAHRRKYEEGTLALAACPTQMPIMASGGADSIIKIINTGFNNNSQ